MGKKKKASSSKLGNKRLNKLAKQGKLKPKRRLAHQGTSADSKLSRDSSEGNHRAPDELEHLDEDDVGFYTSTDAVTGFAASFRKASLQPKRKSDEIEELYEQKPRKKSWRESGAVKHLLPIKDNMRVIPQSMLIPDVPGKDDTSTADALSADTLVAEGALSNEKLRRSKLTVVQLYAERQAKLRERKARIASLSCAIMESPETNIAKLRELRLLLLDGDPDLCLTSRKLVMVSLLEIFKDVLPSYKLRIATEKEKQQVASKETKTLRLYEESLLSNYKHYLQFLEQMVKGDSKEAARTALASASGKMALKTLAIDCLCQLLRERPEFNFFTSIVSVLVPQLACKTEDVCDRVCAAVQAVFRHDRSGGSVSLELVRAICRMIKSRQFSVRSKVLDVFLFLKIANAGIANEADKSKKQPLTHKEKLKSMSRRERKRLKQQDQLDKELEEAEAQENKTRKSRMQTDITQAVFTLYFHVLKKARDSHLLSSVLSGLSKFAHCISIDFFGDLFIVFAELLEKGNLDLKDTLNLVHTAFTIFSGQGSALNIDPMAFYTHLYNKLLTLPAESDDQEMPVLLTCLDLMFAHRRKQVSMQRVLAFVKRLCTVTLQLVTNPSAAAALASVRTFVQTFPKTDMLYNAESVGSGVYLPELAEPEHCNAQGTRLYELHMLKRHYARTVADYAKHLCCGAPSQGRGQLNKERSTQTAAVLFMQMQSIGGPVEWLDSLPKRSNKNPKKAAPLRKGFVNEEFTHLAELYAAEAGVSGIA